MTKHLEDRLSAALDTAARTVPDHAAGPGLFPAPVTQRRWMPVLAVGLAMAAVVTAVAIPIAISRNNAVPPPAAGVCPAAPAVEGLRLTQQQNSGSEYAELSKLPFGPAPKVPFTMSKDAERNGSYLEDRGVRVPLQAGQELDVVGRVDCGWAAFWHSGQVGDEVRVGVLGMDGKLRSFGPALGSGGALAPDGSQFAYVAPAGKGEADLITVSVATGKRLAATPAGAGSQVVGWNGHGVWFKPDQEKVATHLWRPGTEPVAVDTGEYQLTAYRGTDRMLLTDERLPSSSTEPPSAKDEPDPEKCVRVVTLGAVNRLTDLRQECGSTGAGALSPDGRVLVVEKGFTVQGYLVETGAKTSLRASSTIVTVGSGETWEDATHLLSSTGLGQSRQVTTRCDVISGACERIQDGPQEGNPVGPGLGSP